MISTKNYYPIIKDEDLICKVENYDAAINDRNVVYHLHHRNAILLNLSVKQMKEWHIYYHCDPDDLIFLTPSEHMKLHAADRKNHKKLDKTTTA